MTGRDIAMEGSRERLLTVRRVSEFLSCTDQHVYNLIKRRQLKVVKQGPRAYRVPETSLMEFIESNLIDRRNERKEESEP